MRPVTLPQILALGACVLVLPPPAHATYSTVAMERATRRYGAVSASCVRLSTLESVYASLPKRGAVLTQSYLVEGDASQALALELLGQGARAAEVIEAMTDPQFDTQFELRQYVVIDAYGELAAFSGMGAKPFAGHLDASSASFSVGVAGNLLTGQSVLDAAQAGFQDPTACDLEERLLNALVAASADGLGDARCVVEGRPARATWLHVAGSNGSADLDIAVDAAAGVNPIPEVVSRFQEWRSSHPCPVEPNTPDEPGASARGSGSSGACTLGRTGPRNFACCIGLLVWLGRRRARPSRSKS